MTIFFIQTFATRENTAFNIEKKSSVLTFPKKTWKAYFIQKLRHLSVGKYYKTKIQSILSTNHLAQLLCYASIPIVWENPLFLQLIILFFIFKLICYSIISFRLGERINLISLVLFDFIYAIFTPMIAFWSKLEKDIQWTKN